MFINPFAKPTPFDLPFPAIEMTPLPSRASVDELPSLTLPEPSLQSPTESGAISPLTQDPNVSETDIANTPTKKDSVGDSTPQTRLDSRPRLGRNLSSLSLFKKSYSDKLGRVTGGHPSEASGQSKSPASAAKSTSSSSPTSVIHSPQIQAMINLEVAPDLDAVNRALEAINNSPSSSSDSDEEKFQCVRELTTLATTLTIAHRDAKKLLTDAMQARSAGKVEVCRGLCWEIIRSPLAEAVTKVYAYNILSTQSSPGYEQTYLKYSTVLVNDEVKDVGKQKSLLATIALLRESAKERSRAEKVKAKKVEEKTIAAETKSANEWFKHGNSEWRRKVAAETETRRSGDSTPDTKPMVEGKRTPRTEQILQWAAEDVKHVRSAEEILCSCGQKRGRARRCLVHD